MTLAFFWGSQGSLLHYGRSSVFVRVPQDSVTHQSHEPEPVRDGTSPPSSTKPKTSMCIDVYYRSLTALISMYQLVSR